MVVAVARDMSWSISSKFTVMSSQLFSFTLFNNNHQFWWRYDQELLTRPAIVRSPTVGRAVCTKRSTYSRDLGWSGPLGASWIQGSRLLGYCCCWLPSIDGEVENHQPYRAPCLVELVLVAWIGKGSYVRWFRSDESSVGLRGAAEQRWLMRKRPVPWLLLVKVSSQVKKGQKMVHGKSRSELFESEM